MSLEQEGVAMQLSPIVSPQDWEAAREQLLVKEKELTRARDALAAERRRMPWTAVEDIARWEARMGWETIPWYTLSDDFDADFGVGEWHGTNAFIRAGERIFRTYFVNNRGDEAMGSTWSFLDITALGRQEQWEDSPAGYPQTPPYQWWRLHDEYVSSPA
jgi:predicted dithiol-disulfide oxidoreductase (DUF899 family)